MIKVSKRTKRWNKNFLLHKMRRIRWLKERERKAAVQLNVIDGKISYDSHPVQTSSMFDYEVDYMNQFHKENDQALIWVKKTQYKCERRKIILKKALTNQ